MSANSIIGTEVDASTIVFCGVHFMAESAKILSYDKTVLIPDARAGGSLAETRAQSDDQPSLTE